MYRNKKDVDKHVENLISKLSLKEFTNRAYSVARLYFEVGDYPNCQKYVEQYLAHKDNNAAAYKLLGQALQKMGHKEKALEQYKMSIEIDPSQTSTILDICELLADDELVTDPGRAKIWCAKAETVFPKHPITFRLRERLVGILNPDPEALVKLLTSELSVRPNDYTLHIRLLKHFLDNGKYKEAFDHSSKIEFSDNNFFNSYAWYDVLNNLLKENLSNVNDWNFQLLYLTVKERICVLSLTEIPSGLSKSLVESNEVLHTYDQAIETVAKAGASSGHVEFHISLLNHHKGQFALHAATFLLKKAKNEQLSWRDATKYAAPLMLFAWHTTPQDTNVNWLKHAPEKQVIALKRWYLEGTYRCSQSGHYILSNIQDKSQIFLDKISQCCSGTHWRDKLYEILFTNKGQLIKIKSSHFTSNAFGTPILRLPRKNEVEAYDNDAQKLYGNSLHYFVWILRNYINFASFNCTIFDMLKPNVTSSGFEALNKLDVESFLYCATLTSCQQKLFDHSYKITDKPKILPASITDLLCPLTHLKWWDCAYKVSRNEFGTELTDIHTTLSKGIEVVRCIDNHGLDTELLCILGGIFNEKSKREENLDYKSILEARAYLYYSSAIPLLEKNKNKMTVNVPEKRLFDYTHKDLGYEKLNTLIEESKIYVAVNKLKESDYERAIEILSNLKSPQAFYHLGYTYKVIALEEQNIKDLTKYSSLLSKAKTYAFKALDKLKENHISKNETLYSDIQELIEDIEIKLNKIDLDLSGIITNDMDGKYSSDEFVSGVSEQIIRNERVNFFHGVNSTPKQVSNPNNTNYRTAADSQILENTRLDQQYLERIESEIKKLQRRDSTINNFMDQTKDWFEENRKLGIQIISTINSNIQNTTDQFKLLKISVDQVKDQIDECRNECKDVSELKKQLSELKNEMLKLKKATSEQTMNEKDLFNLDESSATFPARLPFTPQVMPQFNQRLISPFPVPPNPYQMYTQSLYNLYNQYSQHTQPPTVAGAPSVFDPARGHVNYPGIYPTPDQMYLDVAHLVPPTIPAAPAVPPVPVVPISNIPTIPKVCVPPPTTVTFSKNKSSEAKDVTRSLPVNVVITSSDPLPTSSSAPAPVLSVTIPPKHIKGTPHNYQIAMPTVNETKVIAPPLFSFPTSENKTNVSTDSSTNWNQSNVFNKNTEPTTTFGGVSWQNSFKSAGDTLDTSKNVVDGSSPNTSLNKSRTLSERSNTSVENYDPCPDFKPIVPLPDEVKITTGEENEITIFSSRAKLFRFVDKQWKERGLGEMKLLKHNLTGKVRVLMRREQIHKICANHIITPEMEIKPMKNETKAYFWVANDFADETVVLEKFCVRFKSADIAKEFYETFEKAIQFAVAASPDNSQSENVSSTDYTSKLDDIVTATSKQNVISTPSNKAILGGFTFSSTPTFKASDNSIKNENKPKEMVSKLNVFSGLTFKTTNSTFGNLFSTDSLSSQISNSAAKNGQEVSINLNTSDKVEEFEPAVEFEPVIPLPALVEQKTGEEDENVLFEHRAKLLRFDSSAKEWKERGLGSIKLLVNKDNIHKVRLLMRREQIMKVCCNHAVTKNMSFQKMPNVDQAVTWCAKDFSEGELVAETFCLRFKTVQICDDFLKAVKSAQSKIKDESKEAKEEKNSAKQIGFGDKFKAKPGSWQCRSCYTNNLENFDKCACCEQPKPAIINNVPITKASILNWSESFKPKPGSWECKECLIRNEAHVDLCSACNNPKNQSVIKVDTQASSDTPKFNFGIPSQTTCTVQKKTEAPTATVFTQSSWGDKFKVKEGTWECQQCFIRNDNSIESCAACNNPKDPNAVKQDNNKLLIDTSSKFKFGVPSQTPFEIKPKTESSIFDGTGSHKFTFGVPLNSLEKTANSLSMNQNRPTAIIFGTQNSNNKPIDFSVTNNNSNITTPAKPALLPTPHIESNFALSGKESGKFGFVFKPKTPPKGKSPLKLPKSPRDDDSDGHEDVSVTEEDHIHFSPVIPLPDKVDVVTGEENETVLYEHRAKLFIFTSSEWKERGIGVVKILKHKDTGKIRIVMRREQVLKICLNHALTSEVMYAPKDDKTWLFAVNDFSEGELNLQNFCLRFKNKEIALQFKNAVEEARSGNASVKAISVVNKNDDDVVFVSEIQSTKEEKQKAKDLLLPENFFTYINKEPCQGCRGCENEDKPKPAEVLENPVSFKTSMTKWSTPMKTSTFSFQSPTNSVYGTPNNVNKTIDASEFRTPLGSIGSNTNSITPISSNIIIHSNTTNKENTNITNVGNLDESNDKSNDSFDITLSSSNVFDAGNSVTPVANKSTVLAPPKLTSSDRTKDQPQTKSIFGDMKSIFGDENKSVPTDSKSIFGDTKSIFGNTNSTFGSANASSFSNKSIFSSSESNSTLDLSSTQKPTSIFSGISQGGSIFGSGDLPKPVSGITGSSSHSVFGLPQSQVQLINKSEEIKSDKEIPLKVDNSLSFAALSSSGPGFGIEKKQDFKWEGAGAQLFGSAQKTPNKSGDKSNNDSGAGDDSVTAAGDEEYDPHYEPIVPLPEKIIVTTGEEDEEKIFGERCKLYRYDDKTREWKERGVGEIKLLFHPGKNTYRLLLRREQVYKVVLNMLLFMDLELLPMKNSDRAWTWAGRNYAEPAGDHETLAVRFKTVDLATTFRDRIVESVRKLQSEAAKAIKEEKESKTFDSVTPLRLPRHLEDSARADDTISASVIAHTSAAAVVTEDQAKSQETQPAKSNAESNKTSNDGIKQVHFQEPEEDKEEEDEDYDNYDQYDAYYNEEEEECGQYFACSGAATVRAAGAAPDERSDAHVQVVFDQDVYSPKILLTDNATGEILADMLIHTDTEFQMSGDSCTWSGTDYASNDPVAKTVTIDFHDSETAMQFYDTCETSKSATYSSTDPES